MIENKDIFNERQYLAKCIKYINMNIDENNKKIKNIVDSIDTSLYDYFNGPNRKNTDSIRIKYSDEFIELSRDLLNEKAFLNVLIKENSYLDKMQKVPYFSEIIFNDECFYIGISSLLDNKNDILIVDWRAPISDLYYNSSLGRASYKVSDNRIIEGNLSLKRQFIIENGDLISYIDSDLKIDDSILIKELSKNSSEKLKNIVSTIQTEQNKAIKADVYNDLVVLGVAGSGKTSVAMHRIAYLIYTNNKIYNSNKIVVLSPNSFFYDYIDNILPSLGEDNVVNFDITYIIEKIIRKYYNNTILSKEMFYMELFDDYSKKKILNVDVNELNELISKEIVYYIKNIDIKFYSFSNSHDEICAYFSSNIKNKRLKEVIKSYKEKIIDNLNKNHIKASKVEIKGLFDDINHMFYKIDCFAILNKFLNNKYKEGDSLEYYDSVYLAYIILKIHMFKDLDIFNHMVIDEIQDYSNIEMEVINMVFNCKKTMVGDINQRLNIDFNYSFDKCNKLELLNSYRSTKEIFEFINCIIPSNKSISVMRHGNLPIVNKCINFDDEIKKVIELIKCNAGITAIICKNNNQRNKWYNILKDMLDIKKVTDKSKSNVIVATIYESKGLEFDNVIVVDVDDENYRYEIENNWLYIACSRAMHNLSLFYCNNISSFISIINNSCYISK